MTWKEEKAQKKSTLYKKKKVVVRYVTKKKGSTVVRYITKKKEYICKSVIWILLICVIL